jgi:hypothetical protein
MWSNIKVIKIHSAHEPHNTHLVLKVRYDSPYVEDSVGIYQIPLSFVNLPLAIVGYLFNLDSEPREVVYYANGPMVDIATNSDLSSTTSLRI